MAELNHTFTIPVIDVRNVRECCTVIGVHVCHDDVCACSLYIQMWVETGLTRTHPECVCLVTQFNLFTCAAFSICVSCIV
jgi:hypothetical protein